MAEFAKYIHLAIVEDPKRIREAPKQPKTIAIKMKFATNQKKRKHLQVPKELF